MKIYQVVDGMEDVITEEDVVYFGTDFEAAKEAKQRLIEHNDAYLTEREKNRAYVEARIYEISDDADLSDDEAVTDAICECGGYDTF